LGSPLSTNPTRRRIVHGLFGTSVTLLAVLTLWWFVFLAGTIADRARVEREQLAVVARLHAMHLSMTDEAALPGALPADPRFEVVASAGPGVAPIPDAGLGVRPTEAALRRVDERLRRQRVMVFGEGTILLALVGACTVMLYRLLLAERRYRDDTDAFLARVTHEMKTPLAGLRALLQSLRDGRVPDERRAELLELGLQQTEREEHLIENLLTAHRMAIGAPPLPTAVLDVPVVLHDFLAHRRQSMGTLRERHEVLCPAGLLARGNAGALTTILDNLADNAFKHGARNLRLRAEAAGQGARLHVEDDGEGFEPGRAEQLFAAFHRSSGTRGGGRHGTGLGLWIARSLAREMGGDLVAHSDGPGTGARFTVVLPPPTGTPA
jgi:hypothetical protein